MESSCFVGNKKQSPLGRLSNYWLKLATYVLLATYCTYSV